MLAALGVDLASKAWRANGTALVEWDERGWRNVELGVIDWPSTGKPTATRLAAETEAFCVERSVAAVALDGPQGWMDPASPLGMRACERAVTTPGKTGPPGSCRPASALPWVELSIEVFAELLAGGRAELVNDPDASPLSPAPAGRFHVLECFPSSTWRRAGLKPLPAGRRRPDLRAYGRALGDAFGLPSGEAATHDDLQALVAALPAAAVLGAPAIGVPAGRPSWETEAGLVEGLIWDALPVGRKREAREPPLLVLVTGPPASGKTTLAEPLARELELPLISRDELKEAMYDGLGVGDVDWTRQLGRVSFDLVHLVAARLLDAGSGAVLEANFFRGVSEAALERLPTHRLVQVHCTAPTEVVLQRYARRDRRHAGHRDHERAHEVAARLRDGSHDPLALPGTVLSVDTTTAVDVSALAHDVRRAAGHERRG